MRIFVDAFAYFFILVGDDKEFADAIIDLLKNPKKADRLGKNASLLRKKLSVETIAKEWENLLND